MKIPIKRTVIKYTLLAEVALAGYYFIFYEKFYYTDLANKLNRACYKNNECIVYLPEVLGYDYDTIYRFFSYSPEKMNKITHCKYEDVAGWKLKYRDEMNEYLVLLFCSKNKILDHTAEFKGYPEKYDHTEHPGEIDLDRVDPTRDTLKYYRTSAKYFKLLHVVRRDTDYFKLTDIPDSVKK